MTAAISAGLLVTGLIEWLHSFDNDYVALSLAIPAITLTIIFWFRDVIREGTFEGAYSAKTRYGFRWGVRLFLVTELMLFISYFWAFFDFRLSPGMEPGWYVA